MKEFQYYHFNRDQKHKESKGVQLYSVTRSWKNINGEIIEKLSIKNNDELLDVDELNKRLLRGEFDVAKASFYAAMSLGSEVGVLPAGVRRRAGAERGARLGGWCGSCRLLDDRVNRHKLDGGQGGCLDERPLGRDGGEPLLRRRRRRIRVRSVFPPQRRVERGAPSAVDQHEGARMACAQIK